MTAERALWPQTLRKGLVDSKLQLCSHYIGQLFEAPRKSMLYSVNSTRVVDTHRISCRRVWPRGFGALNSSPHS